MLLPSAGNALPPLAEAVEERSCVSPRYLQPMPPGAPLPSLRSSALSATNGLSKHKRGADWLRAHLLQVAFPECPWLRRFPPPGSLWDTGHVAAPHLCEQLARDKGLPVWGPRPWLLPGPPAAQRARCPRATPHNTDSGESITVAPDRAAQRPGLASQGLRTPLGVCLGALALTVRTLRASGACVCCRDGGVCAPLCHPAQRAAGGRAWSCLRAGLGTESSSLSQITRRERGGGSKSVHTRCVRAGLGCDAWCGPLCSMPGRCILRQTHG